MKKLLYYVTKKLLHWVFSPVEADVESHPKIRREHSRQKMEKNECDLKVRIGTVHTFGFNDQFLTLLTRLVGGLD
ncbi:hypothetical protein TELCIR_18708 [Teladorsagia circumcincta]|uniref:Uncharacterized protein n=1 Tax=Teladorsagia circumcincta TaxID=45464 RepID=A0A2G9TPF5_TELCI|nr:hypothetical protein TELCIR_18708 [Teladorsagia circumcincta]